MPVLGKAFTALASNTLPQFFNNNRIQFIGDSYMTTSGKPMTPEGALRVGECWTAVTIIADEVATLPVRMSLESDISKRPRPWQLDTFWGMEPNPIDNEIDLATMEVLSMALHGFYITYLGWQNSGRLGIRWALDPNQARFEMLEDSGLKLSMSSQGELYNRAGERPQFEFCPMFKLPSNLRPISPVGKAADLLGLSKAYEEVAARFAAKGFSPSALVSTNSDVSPEEAAALSKRLERLHSGSERSGGVAVLGGEDVKLEKLSMSMVDAEFIAQREDVFKRVMSIWRVPPTVAGLVDQPSTWGTGVAEFSRGLQTFTLRPYVKRREKSKRRYITSQIDPDIVVRYPFDDLLSATPTERTEVQAKRLQYRLDFC